MSIAKVIEVSATSPEGFDDAVRKGISRASSTVENITAAWVKDHKVTVKNGEVDEYLVHMKVTFLLQK